MRKKIYNNKIEKKFQEGSTKEIVIELPFSLQNSFERKMWLILKTLGLILLLLFGPSLIVSIFGDHYGDFSLGARVLVSFVANIIILGILLFIYRDSLIRDFRNFFGKNVLNHLEVAFKYWLVGFMLMIISNFIISILTNGGMAANEESVRELIDLVPIYMLFDVAIYAPLTEELIFRKSIRDFISNKWIYIFVSGFVFGGLHVLSSVSSAMDLLFLIPYCSLGFAFAALYYKSNNIFSSICMHALHNTMAIVLYLL